MSGSDAACAAATSSATPKKVNLRRPSSPPNPEQSADRAHRVIRRSRFYVRTALIVLASSSPCSPVHSRMAATLFTDTSPRQLQRSIAGPRAESYPHSILCSCMSRYFYTYILIHTRTRKHISSYIGLTDVHARVASHNFHSAPKTLQTHLFHATEHESRRSSSIVGDDRHATCAKH